MQGYLGDYQPRAFAAAFAIIFERRPPRVRGYQDHCVKGALYLSNVIWNISTNFALILLPFSLMWNVQVSTQKRWVVIGLFGCRIIMPVFAIAGAVAQAEYWTASPPDPTWYATRGALWNQAVIDLSIISACIPCIKRFLADLSSGIVAVNISEPLEPTIKSMSWSGGPMDSSTLYGGFLRSKLSASRDKSQGVSLSHHTLTGFVLRGPSVSSASNWASYTTAR